MNSFLNNVDVVFIWSVIGGVVCVFSIMILVLVFGVSVLILFDRERVLVLLSVV